MKRENKKAMSKHRKTNQHRAVTGLEAQNAGLKKQVVELQEGAKKLTAELDAAKAKLATPAVSA